MLPVLTEGSGRDRSADELIVYGQNNNELYFI